MLKRSILSVVITTLSAGVVAEEASATMEQVTIIGSAEQAHRLPGSGSVVDGEQLDIEAISDINQALKTVPGLYIREEDGHGLRPNIGIRGATGARSGKITLMEDGVLIAPAPYSAPSAYYFPTALRISGIEVLKGASLLRYGPQTTGGVINLLSTPIPADAAGSVAIVVNQRGSNDVHAHYGATQGQLSWLLEAVRRDNTGFKDIDRSRRDSGFAIHDYVGKLAWQGENQSVLLKLQHSTEQSNETYLGLSDADFNANKNRRYGLSDLDQMDNRHKGISLSHSFEWSDRIESTATYYRNEFNRDWFKLNTVGRDGNNKPLKAGHVIEAANAGNAAAQGIVDGRVDVTELSYKHNKRGYVAEGVQLGFDIELDSHRLAIGGRSHEDRVDRYQPSAVYDQINGALIPVKLKAPASGDNRLEESSALSLWLTDNWQLSEALAVNLALRYEAVDSQYQRYGNTERTLVARSGSNSSKVFLPGVAFTYELNGSWQALAGFHQGFSPLGGGADSEQKPEASDNWELGLRYQNTTLFAEAIAFHSGFSEKAEVCSVGAPCSNGAIAGNYVTGEAVIKGIELQLGTHFKAMNFEIPIDAAYTHTEAEATKTTAAIKRGDTLKDIPENSLSLRLGLEHTSGWDNYVVAKYIDETCVRIGCQNSDSRYGKTEDLLVVDLISRYRLHNAVALFAKAENLFNQQKIVSRAPDGARPNKPMTFSVGMLYDF